MSSYISVRLRAQLAEADRGRCAYCQTSEVNSGLALTVDRIRALARGGTTTFENLCLACYACNEHKRDAISATDPLTAETVPLYNPRLQIWDEHFAWSEDGTRIVGLTAIGRATIVALELNNEKIVPARRRWVSAGWHPPME